MLGQSMEDADPAGTPTIFLTAPSPVIFGQGGWLSFEKVPRYHFLGMGPCDD